MISEDSLLRPLVLSSEVLLTEAALFPKVMQDRMNAKAGDRVLSLRRSRYTSQRVDHETAQFLRHFERPTEIAAAVVAHSAETGEEPSSLLRAVFPLICQLTAQRVLVPSHEASEPSRRLRVGDTVLGYKLLDCIEAETETEIHCAIGAAGKAVLKYVPNAAPVFVRNAIKIERAVLGSLERAAMPGVPRVLGAQGIPAGNILLLIWQEGEALAGFAARRELSIEERTKLCLRLADRYSELHANGFLHGDVHARNVIVSHALDVALIDFGAAARIGSASKRRRMALLPDLEPEAALDLLAGKPMRSPSAAGEQYCLAALIFSVLTDEAPVQLSLETKTAMHQIASVPAASLIEKGINLPEVEHVLHRALAKDPVARFNSVESFSRALAGAASREFRRPTQLRARRSRDSRQLSIAAAYGLDSRLILSELPHGARAGIYYGAAGIAYALARSAILEEDPEALAAAEVWIERALTDTDSAAFEWPEFGVTSQAIGQASPFNGRAGIRLSEAMIRLLSGDHEKALSACLDLASPMERSSQDGQFDPMLDLLHGNSGRLLGLALLMPMMTAKNRRTLLVAARPLFSATLAAVSKRLECWPPSQPEYLGLAHGLAGATYGLLSYSEAATKPPPDVILAALDRLAAAAVSSADGLVWPLRTGLGDVQSWSGWCHGSAGHVLLWCTAARVLDSTPHVERAIAAGTALCAASANAAPTLCCGGPGEALALFQLGRLTDDGRWFDSGRKRLSQEPGGDPEIPARHSLFRGRLGAMLSRMEAKRPERSAWPFCTSPF